MRFSTPLGFTSLIDDNNDGFRINYYSNRDYHCPQCGKIWARWEMELVDPDERPPLYYAFRRSCPAHPSGAWNSDFPGSQLLYPSDITVMPRALLIQELLLRTTGVS